MAVYFKNIMQLLHVKPGKGKGKGKAVPLQARRVPGS